MLSRIVSRAALQSRPSLGLVARTSSTAVATTISSSGVEVANVEKPKMRVEPGKVRMGFVPEEFFQYFYPKTGVTGPYIFGASFFTFLFSKEYIVVEEEIIIGISEALMAYVAIKKFGPSVAKYFDDEIDDQLKSMRAVRGNEIDRYNAMIEDEKKVQYEAEGQTLLFDAKKENVGLQLEAGYRQRLSEIHAAVKKRLDYHVEMENVQRRIEHSHMVSWIIDEAKKAITPQVQDAYLKQCVDDLKGLAARAQATA